MAYGCCMGHSDSPPGEAAAPADAGSAAGAPAAPIFDRRLVMFGLMLCMGLTALDSTIVSTAIPSITRDLGGFSLFPWVFSAYLLVQAVTIPIYGKLADQYGRKPILMAGVAMFLLGSMLSGLSWNMPALILFRGLQGFGAGAVQPITMTVVGDMFTVRERARMQGYFSSVFGLSSVLGPAVGGVLVQYASWHWIFYINLPIGLAAAYMIWTHFHERVAVRVHKVDYLGASLLAVAVGLLVLDLLEGGVGWSFASGDSIGLLAAAAALLLVFVRVEARAPEPILPMWVFREPLLIGANAASLTIGALSIGLSTFLPTYVQGTMGATPLIAGAVLASMSVAWPMASSQAGRLYLRIGFRDTALVGSLITVVASMIFLFLPLGAVPWQAGAASFVMGIGLGFAALSLVVGVQSAVDWNRRGTVTGANMFTRTVGSTLGAAVYGALLNGALAAWLLHAPASLRGILPHSLNATSLTLGPHGGIAGMGAAARYVRLGLFNGMHLIFFGLLVAATLTFALLWLMPRHSEAIASETTATAMH